MFKSQSKYKLFTYSILFEDIINPFIELISDILSIAKEDNWGIITAIDFSKINKSLAGEIQALECKNRSFSQDKKLFIRNKKVLTEELKKRQEVIENDVERLKKWGNESINEYFFNEIFSLDNLSKYERSRIFLLDRAKADLIYIDPPYFNSKGSHLSYHSRYHFLEGLANYNEIENFISLEKNNKEIRINNLIEFENKLSFCNDLRELISKHRNSVIVISYRNMGYPSIEEIKNILSEFKSEESIHVINLGEYSYALNRSRIKANEFLIIGK